MKRIISMPMFATPSVNLLTLVIADKAKQRERDAARERDAMRELRYDLPVPREPHGSEHRNEHGNNHADVDSFDPDE